MTQYHVVKDGRRWVVKVNGSPVKRGNTKQTAVQKAKELARNNPRGEVVIHDRNGVIQNRVSPR